MTDEKRIRHLMDMRDCHIESLVDVYDAIKLFLQKSNDWDGIILAPSQAEVILAGLPTIPGTIAKELSALGEYPVEIE